MFWDDIRSTVMRHHLGTKALLASVALFAIAAGPPAGRVTGGGAHGTPPDDVRAGDDAVVCLVAHDGTSVTVRSTKAIGNVQLTFADGAVQKFEEMGDEVHEATYAGTGDNEASTITAVHVKSGDNNHGAGGLGALVEENCGATDDEPGDDEPAGDEPAGDEPTDEAPEDGKHVAKPDPEEPGDAPGDDDEDEEPQEPQDTEDDESDESGDDEPGDDDSDEDEPGDDESDEPADDQPEDDGPTDEDAEEQDDILLVEPSPSPHETEEDETPPTPTTDPGTTDDPAPTVEDEPDEDESDDEPADSEPTDTAPTVDDEDEPQPGPRVADEALERDLAAAPAPTPDTDQVLMPEPDDAAQDAAVLASTLARAGIDAAGLASLALLALVLGGALLRRRPAA